ncbi:MAG: histidinol-phosphate transaminase [Euryarchaeota archaeon]|nr:histidinol-phosphate transaminase [Euryarchaeota archaeon]
MRARKGLEEVMPYSVPISRRGMIRLDLNENTQSCSLRAVEAIKDINSADISSYPDYALLIDDISTNLSLQPASILPTNGADGAIRSVMDTYIAEDDKIVLPTPYFSMYKIIAEVRGAEVVAVPYNEDLSFPEKALLAQRGKLTVIVNPGNPTGSRIPRDTFIEIMGEVEGIVILDEAYYQFAGESFIDLIERFDNLIVIHTFSKAYGLAGLRLGYIASASQNIEEIRKVNPPFPVSSAAVVAGRAAIADTEHIKRVVTEIRKEKEFLHTQLTKMGVKTRRTKTNFILVQTGEETSRVCSELRKRGILVKNMSTFPLLKGYLRVTVGTHTGNIVLLKTLREILPLQGILFDMDGVLVDVGESYRRTIKETAEEFRGEEVSMEEIEEYKKRGGYNNDWDLTEALIRSSGKKILRETIIEHFQRRYLGKNFDGYIANEQWLLDKSLLRELSTRYSLGIVTGRPREEAVYTLTREKVAKYFDCVITMDEVPGKEKPDPYGIRMAVQQLDISRALYLGDTVDDLRAATSAGVIPVSIGLGGIREENVVYILKSVNEIEEIVW